MANPVNALEERLQRLDQMTQRIIDAAFLPVRQPVPREVWWEHVVSIIGDEGDALFNQVRINKPVRPVEKKLTEIVLSTIPWELDGMVDFLIKWDFKR